jgi:ABC-2 type transport system permease protein
MRASMVWAVLAREAAEMIRNRLLVGSILVPPIVLTIGPLLLGGLVREEALPPELVSAILAQRPEWASLEPGDLAAAWTLQQFLVFFLVMPAYIPLSIATFSIIGEKQARSLEAVLATPIRTAELLAGKAIAAVSPGILAGWIAYIAFVLLSGVIHGPAITAIVTDGSWLAGVFLLGPAVGLVSVVIGVIVSSRVNDPRVAQQIGGVIILPLVGVTVLQATGAFLVGATGYAAAAVVVFVIGVIGLRLGVALFQREAILTRWR